MILLEAANYQRDAEYYKSQYEQEKARADRLSEELTRVRLIHQTAKDGTILRD